MKQFAKQLWPKGIRVIVSFTCAMPVMLIIGCSTPLDHVGAFSRASADLAKNTAEAYESINTITVKRRISGIAADKEALPDEGTFKKIINDRNMAARISLLKGVQKYAQALGELATADFRNEIAAASKDLYGALGDLQDTYAKATNRSLPLSSENLSLIATAVDAIGTGIAESYRREALKTIVIQADPSIKQAMDQVGNELQILMPTVRANLDSIYTDMFKAYGRDKNGLSYTDRENMLCDIWKAYDRYKTFPVYFETLSSASAKVSSAHAALKKAVEANEFTTKELVEEIKSMAQLAISIKDFHDKLLVSEDK